MTLRRRLTLWYGAVLMVCVGLAVFPAYDELVIDAPHHSNSELLTGWQRFHAVLFDVALGAFPAVSLGLIGGWFYIRRALRPLDQVAELAERLDENTLSQRLPEAQRDVEIQRLAHVFNTMAARLESSFDRVREFTLHASHELKTPLAILRGEMETRLRSRNDLSEDDSSRIASQIDEIDRLVRIVDGLSLLVKADAKQVHFASAPVALHDLVSEIVIETEALASPGNITVRLLHCAPTTILGDRDRLRQVLLNLADNAIKHNELGGFAEFELQQQRDHAQLIVRNSGDSIAAEHHHRVFDRFYRGPSPRGESEGSGLGLSIVQWIVQSHGGSVLFYSESGVTTVTVRLPIGGTTV